MSEVFAGDALFERQPSEQEIQDWTDLLAQRNEPENQGEVLSLLVFRLGEELLAMRTAEFQEVVEMGLTHKVPHRDSSVLRGLVNIRGRLELCVGLDYLLGSAPEDLVRHHGSGPGQLLLVGREGQRFAFPISEVVGITKLAQRRLTDHQSGSLVRFTFNWRERMVGLLESAAVHGAVMERIGR